MGLLFKTVACAAMRLTVLSSGQRADKRPK